jgi:phosphatidylinositol-3-phosphatase
MRATVLASCLLSVLAFAAAPANARPLESSTSPQRLQPATLPSVCGTGLKAPARFRHVIVIMDENHSYGDIIGNKSAPYENAMANACGLATNYHAVMHLSYYDYSAATSGMAYPPGNATSIFQQMTNHSLTWGAYEQSMPTPCRHTDAYPYESGHNPPPRYGNIAAACLKRDVGMGTPTSGPLNTALVQNKLPSFVWLTPDKCHDMHDNCYGTQVLTGDRWIESWVTRIVRSSAYQSGGTAIFITWDEGWEPNLDNHNHESCVGRNTDQSCHVATIVISPYTPHGTRSSTLFNHYSLLKTVEMLFTIPEHVGAAGAASTISMVAPFKL